ncbi:MAG: uroporphyrinogen-III synthase [Cytophagales bacterium]|nr:MAG: uroporphyrinogen-III synthase [Cytophagales bacterium]
MNEVKTKTQKDRLSKVSSVLISQARPIDEKSPYYIMASKYNLKIDFRPFIQVDALDYKEFKKQKINILAHTAIIFTSRNAIDNFFKICIEAKIEMPTDMKYFCVSEQTSNYLQKYIVIRKRKIFTGERTAKDLEEFIKKNKEENYLFPCSNIRKEELPDFMSKNNIKFTEAIIYKTVASDLSDIDFNEFDIISFFSPSGVASLFSNYPDFEQKNIRIATFGPTTAKAVRDAGLLVDIEAPMPNAPSMTAAIEQFIKKANNVK